MAENTIPREQSMTQQNTSVTETREPDRYLVPAVDIYETDDGLTLVADVPGVETDGLDIRVEEGILTIRGTSTWAERQNTSWREFEVVDYYRQFRLNDQVDHEKISAALANGVLTLQLPKAAKAKPRQIEVKTV